MTEAQIPDDQLMSRKELASAIGAVPETIDRWIEYDPTFPAEDVMIHGEQCWFWGSYRLWQDERRTRLAS